MAVVPLILQVLIAIVHQTKQLNFTINQPRTRKIAGIFYGQRIFNRAALRTQKRGNVGNQVREWL